MKQTILGLIVCMSLLGFTSICSAALVTFTIPDGLATQGPVQIVSSGITLTLSNPIDATDNPGTFSSNSNGLFFSNEPANLVNQNLRNFSFTFSKRISIVSYDVGPVLGNDTGIFNLRSTPDTGSSVNNFIFASGSFPIMGTFELDTSQTGTWDTSEITSGGMSGFPPFYQIRSITVNEFPAAVPVPSAMLLMSTGLLGLIGYRKWTTNKQ